MLSRDKLLFPAENHKKIKMEHINVSIPCSSEENVERANMIKSLVRVKEVVGETAKQFNLSQKEVLRMASDQE